MLCFDVWEFSCPNRPHAPVKTVVGCLCLYAIVGVHRNPGHDCGAKTPSEMPSSHMHPIIHVLLVLLPSSKAGRARHILNLLELDAHLHNTISYHPRIQTHRPSQGVLCFRTRIEAHNEVVPDVVCGL